jgi:2'-5' RNA ligase
MFYYIAIPIELDAQTQNLISQELQNHKLKLVDNYHITIQYFGEVSSSELAEIKKIFDKFEFKSFQLTFHTNLEAFANWNRCQVIYVPVFSAKLRDIASIIHNLCNGIFAIPHFVPHLTFARVKEELTELEKEKLKNTQILIPPQTVTQICLYKTELTPNGVVHTQIKKSKLRL